MAESQDHRIIVPAREARGVRVRARRRFRIIDLDGRQCVDLFAFNTKDPSEYASAEHTRVHVGRLFPHPDEHFVTNRRRPILFFEQDSSPGVHDMLVAACDPTRYQRLGVEGWHPSCQENLLKAMGELGYDGVEVPQPINLFTNIPVREDGTIEWLPALTKPGDNVTCRAEMDCIVIASSCPQDVVPINDKNPTPIAIDILD